MRTAHFFVALLLLAACAKEHLTQEQMAFKEKCIADGHQWMKMSEMKDGMMSGPPCYGCMADEKNHICTQQAYEEHIKGKT